MCRLAGPRGQYSNGAIKMGASGTSEMDIRGTSRLNIVPIHVVAVMCGTCPYLLVFCSML